MKRPVCECHCLVRVFVEQEGYRELQHAGTRHSDEGTWDVSCFAVHAIVRAFADERADVLL